MGQPFSSRDDIKRDVLRDYFKWCLEWIAGNRQTFFSIVGTVFIALAVVIYVFTNFRSLRKEAWERYSAGQNWAYSNNPENALNAYNDVINNFGRTPAAVYSLLAKADLLHQQRQYSQAVETYKKCLEKKPSNIILPFVLSGLGTAQEDSGDYLGAVESFKRFAADYPDHILAPKVYESLGRAYELSRNLEAAKEIYEKMITAFPSTLWATKARDRYRMIAPTPFQSTAFQSSEEGRPGN